jgi:hypothetical protein
MDYRDKYLKYKSKYLKLKNLLGGQNNDYAELNLNIGIINALTSNITYLTEKEKKHIMEDIKKKIKERYNDDDENLIVIELKNIIIYVFK